MKYFQSKPSYGNSFQNAIWKNLFHTEERCLCCPCQLSEHVNSPSPDFKADTCFHDGKAPAVCSQRLPRICSLRVHSRGIPVGAEQQQRHRSKQPGKGLFKIPLPVKVGMHPIFYRPSPSPSWLQPSEKLLKTKTPIALSCIHVKQMLVRH